MRVCHKSLDELHMYPKPSAKSTFFQICNLLTKEHDRDTQKRPQRNEVTSTGIQEFRTSSSKMGRI
jgi:hypothetical protein